MNIEVNERDIIEIKEIIIPQFVELYADKCTSIGSIAIALQGIINEVEKIEAAMKNNQENPNE